MKLKISVALCFLTLVAWLYAEKAAGTKGNEIGATVSIHALDPDAMRLEGEKRFRANCGRCHAAPQKFPPRMMATVLRHMRVRALITDEDRRLVLFYMTQ
ncbi:MAG TPA: cytochrome c [Candidatus Sulfotelmatobacter sp.]